MSNYQKQWEVPSSSGGKSYTVSLTQDGEYVCHCWPFLRNRQDCKHITAVKNGEASEKGSSLPPEPVLVYASVNEVQRGEDGKLLVPLLPFGGEHDAFAVTIFFDLLVNGVRFETIKRGYRLNAKLKLVDLIQHVRQLSGRTVLDPNSWVDGRGYTQYRTIPFPNQHIQYLQKFQ